jgi:L-ascorbate metabolism protein UlaG (beta-lactamase superfamily)
MGQGCTFHFYEECSPDLIFSFFTKQLLSTHPDDESHLAFLPMNLPYTMTPEMVADAARSFRPKVLYPYHYGETDPARIVALLKENRDIEVRIRRMK